jgi:hypothetical protein
LEVAQLVSETFGTLSNVEAMQHKLSSVVDGANKRRLQLFCLVYENVRKKYKYEHKKKKKRNEKK